MSLESSISDLLQQQEQILAIFNTNTTNWNAKLDLTGGVITGNLVFSNIGTISNTNKTVEFDASFTIKSNLVDTNSILNINSNGNGKAILNIATNDVISREANINIGNLLQISRLANGNSLISHSGLADFNISTVNNADINFLISNQPKLRILSTGNLEVSQTITIFQNLLLTTNSFIGQVDSTKNLKLTGGHNLANNNASIVLHSGGDLLNPGGIDIYSNGDLTKVAITINNQRHVSFGDNVNIPSLNLINGVINSNQAPQLNFIDSSQTINNKLWQIKAENSNLTIQALDDNHNPGTDVVKFIRSNGTNSLAGVSFGTDNEILIDVLTPSIKVNNQSVLGARRSGWLNISGLSNMSKDIGLLSADTSDTAKILRALVSELVAHGLIGA